MEKLSEFVNINERSSWQINRGLLCARILSNYASITAVGIWVLERHYVNTLIEDKIINLSHWGNSAMSS